MNPLAIIRSFSTLSRLEKIIVFIIAALGIGSLIITTYFPVNAFDSIVLYDFRAKIITHQGFYTQIAKNFSYFTGYPLFTSLSHTLVYIFGGHNPQFLYSFMYLSFIFIFYSTLRKLVDRKIALLMSLILASTSVIFDHSTFAYTNLPYTIFLVTGSIYLFIWFVKRKPIGYLILAAILTGLSTWTRSSEPFWMVNIIILGLLSIYKFKKYLFPTFIYIIFFLLIREPWKLVNYYQSIIPGTVSALPISAEIGSYATMIFGTTFNQARIIEVAKFLYYNVITSWIPLLYLFIFCVFVNFKINFKKTNLLFLAIIILHFIFLLYSTYMFSFNFVDIWKEIPDSAMRMAIFFMPLMTFYIGLCLEQIFSSKKILN